jgi:single-stranded DNA-binding protein
MIDALIGGTLHGAAVEKTGQAGKPFVVCKVRTPMQSGEALFVNVIAFDRAACAALLALHAGEPVSIAGTLTPKVWTPPQGEPRPVLDMQAHAVLTTYAVQRKRKAVEPQTPHGKGTAQAAQHRAAMDALEPLDAAEVPPWE